uniref:Reverse transcriptase domain-containing protein n=1 Tax=Trichobilharzia regenti TaxID=157069 RepID=A0AA85JUT7_TRIRE|nr:unnamed protein product [Trichobilharzia regenti]
MQNCLPMNINSPTKAEILNALKLLKSGKVGEPNGIPLEALKTEPETEAGLLAPLLQNILKEEKAPTIWKKGHSVKLPKKDDLRLRKNWRGVMLLSAPSKILNRVILGKIKKMHWMQNSARPEQAGLRKGD